MLAALTFATSAARSQPTNLDKFFAIANPMECSESADFAAFRQSLFRYEGDYDRVAQGQPVIAQNSRAAFGRARYERSSDGMAVSFVLRTFWHGLKLRGFRAYAWDGGDPGGWLLLFDEPPSKVIETVNRLGFKLPKSGIRTIVDNPYEAQIKVVREGSGSAFGCTA